MALPLDRHSDALAEAYSSAPVDKLVLHTLEFIHPAIVDEEGEPTAIRVVSDAGIDLGGGLRGYELPLEATAQLNAGEDVIYLATSFDISFPVLDANTTPELTIKVDNAASLLMPHLDAIVGIKADLIVNYRAYFSDSTEPEHIIRGLRCTDTEANQLVVQAKASFVDLLNRSFPSKVYSISDFPALLR